MSVISELNGSMGRSGIDLSDYILTVSQYSISGTTAQPSLIVRANKQFRSRCSS